MNKREVRRYAQQPWTKELRRDADGSIFARVVELPGCMTSGAGEVEALTRLDAALELWLEVELERGHAIPEPLPPARDYSGKFTVRTSPLVHRLAADAAEGMGVSLNEFASEALAIAAGAAAPLRRIRSPR